MDDNSIIMPFYQPLFFHKVSIFINLFTIPFKMKYKIAFLLTMFFLLGTIISAQNWEKKFPSDTVIGSTGLTMGLKVEQALDGGYLLGGGVSYPTGAPRDYIRLVKTDGQGNTTWQHTYNAGDVSQKLFTYLNELPTGNILLAGTAAHSPYLKLVDTEGEMIWEKTFQNDTIYYSAQYGMEYSEDSFILMGFTSISFVGEVSLFILKIDYDGNLLWEKNHPTTNTGIPSAIDLTTDGGFVITGTLNQELSLTKLNSNGDLEWSQIYQVSDDDRGIVVKRTSDNGFLIGGSTHGLNNNYFPVMIKTDSFGGAEWVKIFDDLSGGITAIQPTPDDGFIATGAIKEFWNFSNNGFILKTNSAGEVEWSEDLNFLNQQIADIKIANDGGYILGGRSGDGMLLKKVGGTTSIKNTLIQKSIEVFPNPMIDQTVFKFNDFDFKTKQLQIFDSKGSLVLEKIFTGDSFVFYRKEFNSGIYFYQIKKEGNIIGNGKLMIND